MDINLLKKPSFGDSSFDYDNEAYIPPNYLTDASNCNKNKISCKNNTDNINLLSPSPNKNCGCVTTVNPKRISTTSQKNPITSELNLDSVILKHGLDSKYLSENF